MHKHLRQGIDTRVAYLTGLRRVEMERADGLDDTPLVETSIDAPPAPPRPAPRSNMSQPLPLGARHRYWVPGPIRRLAAHIREYFTGHIRHDLYVHVDRATESMLEKLAAEHQETRGQLRRLSSSFDDLSRRFSSAEEPRPRDDGDALIRGPSQRARQAGSPRTNSERASAFAIEEARKEVAHCAETLRRDLAEALDALQSRGVSEAFPEEIQRWLREEIRAVADTVERLTTDQTAILSQLERSLSELRIDPGKIPRQ